MMMHQVKGFVPFVAFIQGIIILLPSVSGGPVEFHNALVDSGNEFNLGPHDLERMYTSEYKRLPVYDFGLGKRGSEIDQTIGGRGVGGGGGGGSLGEYDEYSYAEDDDDSLPELELYHDDIMQAMDKRQKLYNFGLGKRQRYDFGLGKRGRGYDFGLGKRSLEMFHPRDRLYNMGLGKRNRQYSFGLGKRPYNPNVAASRFNFGLGKRSDNIDSSKNPISKREIHEKNMSIQNNNEEHVTDEKNTKGKKTEQQQQQQTNDVQSRSFKRSYSYGAINNPNYRSSIGFSRQFRKPIYNFGLGKRTNLSAETINN